MMRDTTIAIDGMNCGHCVMSVKKALATVPGLEVKDVKIGAAEVCFDPSAVSLESIRAALAKAGYELRAD